MAALVGLYGEPLEGTQLAADDLVGVARTLKRAGSDRSRVRRRRRARSSAAPATTSLRARAEIARRAATRRARSPTSRRSPADVDDPRVRLELAKLYEHYVEGRRARARDRRARDGRETTRRAEARRAPHAQSRDAPQAGALSRRVTDVDAGVARVRTRDEPRLCIRRSVRMPDDVTRAMSDETRYDPADIEPKWQRIWEEKQTFRAERHAGRPKTYILDMFPYPSGVGPPRRPPRGLHRDRHRRALQAHARLRRAAPDGLGRVRPARRAARDRRPARTRATTTRKNIATFKRQLKMLGFSYDWSREVDTTDPGVRQLDAVDLPPALQARARVPGARSRSTGARRSAPCSRTKRSSTARASAAATRSSALPLRQWMLRITAYADRLARRSRRRSTGPTRKAQAARLDRPQRRRGRRVRASTDTPARRSRVFTTRADTLLGRDVRRARARASARRRAHRPPTQRAAVERVRRGAAKQERHRPHRR